MAQARSAGPDRMQECATMTIAISGDHRALGDTVAEFLTRRDSRGAARALLEAADEPLPSFWNEMAELGWLGLHLPEAHGGSGFGLAELAVVVEGLARAVAPGPFVPTVVAGALLAGAAPAGTQARVLPGLADGSTVGTFSLNGDLVVRGTTVTGDAGSVLAGGLAQLLVARVGDDAVVVDLGADGVTVTVPANLDPTRRSAQVTLDDAAAEILPGAGQLLTDLARTIVAAEAMGIARECTEMAAEYAKVREQFGRPIAMYQAVKHHCANMAVETELTTAATWDAARAAESGGDQFTLTAAMAAAIAIPAADLCANLNIQVHGGIGFTWEHDAHLYLRRATVLAAVIDADAAAAELTALVRRGVERERAIALPPDAEPIRDEVRAFAEQVKGLDPDARRAAMIDTGYAVPHWPAPWGRNAGAIEQLVIEEEFSAAGIKRPSYGITGWVILTLVQHATEDQVARWVRPALNQELIWCQLFSEPEAGSDAAGVKTRAVRVDGGWIVNGQKVWTSGAHQSRFGLATVRTNPDAPKHQGITTMVIDMEADGVEVRPLRMISGHSEFNEVFFDDVFIPDDDVVGPIDGGWTVARATLGNESVSIGGGDGGMALGAEMLVAPFDAHPDRLTGGAARVGRYAARTQAIELLNLRSAHRAVAGAEPGPEGAITKLVLSENGHEAAAILAALAGPHVAFMEGEGQMAGYLVLMHRAMSIAGGTSEIKRNQIGERILGLPRDPLIR
jgi:alkylation response protein AidB-like acyl-CoA dehydrogenase